jgi:hypothetical protein
LLTIETLLAGIHRLRVITPAEAPKKMQLLAKSTPFAGENRFGFSFQTGTSHFGQQNVFLKDPTTTYWSAR